MDGLPLGAETTSDVGTTKTPYLLQALDLTQDQVQNILHDRVVKPDFIFFDLAYWVPSVVHPLGIKSIYLSTSSVLSCIGLVPRLFKKREEWTEIDEIEPPEAYPGSSTAVPLAFEMKDVMYAFSEFNGKISLIRRYVASFSACKAFCFSSCNEMEDPYVDYLKKQYNKEVLLIGPALAEKSETPLDEKWEKWLSGFEVGSVVYCAFGSECILSKEQFQELILGLELTSLPFFVRLKPPEGVETLEAALPEGFQERVKGRGIVHEGWVQQQHILAHPSVGCFVSHAGFGSMWESLASACQIVLIPNVGDQFLNTKFMTKGLKVAVDVERREEDGWFTKENVCKAVKVVMEEGRAFAEELSDNHRKWKDFLTSEGLEAEFYSTFIHKLQDILSCA